jgi:hypothetical protein
VHEMDKFIPTFTDITQWKVNKYTNTGGTRSKQIAIHPKTEKQFFFKGSKVVTETLEIKYPTEFWSEIVSSKIGQYLGFNVLDYNIGYSEKNIQKVGCLSESMIENSLNKLTEGVTYLTGFNPAYRPALKAHQDQYTFQFILEALQSFGLNEYVNELIEMIVFDSIISNSDRHQENWGVISYYNDTLNIINQQIELSERSWFQRTSLKLSRWYTRFLSKHHETWVKKPQNLLAIQSQIVPHKFAPIYDSGCCLGREIENDKISQYLKDNQLFESYINKGYAEIRWKGNDKKLNHFDLVKLLFTEYKVKVTETIERTIESSKDDDIAKIIADIDKNLPAELSFHGLANNRKELMIKMVHLRLKKLKELI